MVSNLTASSSGKHLRLLRQHIAEKRWYRLDQTFHLLKVQHGLSEIIQPFLEGFLIRATKNAL